MLPNRTRRQRILLSDISFSPLTPAEHSRVCQLAVEYRQDFWEPDGFGAFAAEVANFFNHPDKTIDRRAVGIYRHFHLIGGFYFRCSLTAPARLTLEYIVVDQLITEQNATFDAVISRVLEEFSDFPPSGKLHATPRASDEQMRFALERAGIQELRYLRRVCKNQEERVLYGLTRSDLE